MPVAEIMKRIMTPNFIVSAETFALKQKGTAKDVILRKPKLATSVLLDIARRGESAIVGTEINDESDSVVAEDGKEKRSTATLLVRIYSWFTEGFETERS